MVEKIGLGDKEWTIDSRDLNFTDATLNAFFEKVGAIISDKQTQETRRRCVPSPKLVLRISMLFALTLHVSGVGG